MFFLRSHLLGQVGDELRCQCGGDICHDGADAAVAEEGRAGRPSDHSLFRRDVLGASPQGLAGRRFLSFASFLQEHSAGAAAAAPG